MLNRIFFFKKFILFDDIYNVKNKRHNLYIYIYYFDFHIKFLYKSYTNNRTNSKFIIYFDVNNLHQMSIL